MTIQIRDMRHGRYTAVKDMPDGTWFMCNLGLRLKASPTVCVDGETGKRVPFHEEHVGQPVDVEINVLYDSLPAE